MTQSRRKNAPRKRDKFTTPDVRDEENKLYYALAPLGKLEAEMDGKWGVGVLPSLVTPEMAARFGNANNKLDAALEAKDYDEVVRHAAVCMRGLHALDSEAEQLGHEPIVDFIEFNDGKNHFAVARTNRDWPVIQNIRPGITVYSIQEIAAMLKHYEPVEIVKDKFPGAKLESVKPLPKDFFETGDEIPW